MPPVHKRLHILLDTTLLAGMDLSLWPRVRKLFVDWGYRGLKETASSLGLELEVVARPYAGVRGVWVPEGAEVPEIPRESGWMWPL
jgi:hypothetical protein